MRVGRYGLYRDSRTATCTALLALAMAGFVVPSAKADDNVRSFPPDTESFSQPVVPDDNVRSFPPDTTSYSRPLVSEDLTLGSTAGTAGLAGASVSFSVVD